MVTHIGPTNRARSLLRLSAALVLTLALAAPASAQLPALPTGDLPALPSASHATSVGGASVSASSGGHAVGACADADPHAAADAASAVLPGQAQQVVGTARGAASTATALAPVQAPAIDAPDCLRLDADHPDEAVEEAKETASGATGGLLRWFSSLFGGLF